MKKQKSKSSIELERVCPRCKGAGGEKRDYDNVWDECVQCGGSGHIVTAAGEKVLSLMEHSLKPLLLRAIGDLLQADGR